MSLVLSRMSFNEKTVLISGASSGIGRELALQLHEQGAKLVLVARRGDLLQELKVGLEKFREQSVQVMACDLCQPHSAEFGQLIELVKNQQIDILINNAGRGSFGYFEEQSLESELQMVELNVLATMRLAHAVIPQMKERKSGAIISVSSIAGYQPIPLMSTYAATKAFNLFHSMGLWAELKEFGIRTMIVCPGPVATEFGGVARVPGTFSGGARDSAKDVVRWALRDFARGKLVSLPGLRAKAIVALVKVLPAKLLTAIVVGKLKTVLRRSTAG